VTRVSLFASFREISGRSTIAGPIARRGSAGGDLTILRDARDSAFQRCMHHGDDRRTVPMTAGRHRGSSGAWAMRPRPGAIAAIDPGNEPADRIAVCEVTCATFGVRLANEWWARRRCASARPAIVTCSYAGKGVVRNQWQAQRGGKERERAAPQPFHALFPSSDLPDGPFCQFAVQPFPQKYFASRFGRNSFLIPPSRPHKGAYRDRHGRGARDAAAAARRVNRRASEGS
jgi:hypothetical protein